MTDQNHELSGPPFAVDPEPEDDVLIRARYEQKMHCRIPEGDLPDDLSEALRLRVDHLLAGGNSLTDEIRALEAPYSLRVSAAERK